MIPPTEQPAPRASRDGGTSQAERLPMGLLPPALQLDGRTPLELLAYVTRFSEEVQFYNSADGPTAGRWDLAQHRRLLLLALAATQPGVNQADNMEATLTTLLTPSAGPAQQRAARQTLLALLRREAARIDSWHSYPSDGFRQLGFTSALEAAWYSLKGPLALAARHEARLLAGQAIDAPPQPATSAAPVAQEQPAASATPVALATTSASADPDTENEYMMADAQLPASATAPAATEATSDIADDAPDATLDIDTTDAVATVEAAATTEELPDAAEAAEALLAASTSAPTAEPLDAQALHQLDQELVGVFRLVLKSLDTLAAVAQRSFYNSLSEFQDHHPEVALLVAFVQLFGHAQQVLNDVPRRHLDYYYRQVLRTTPRASTPDEVNLSFTLTPGQPAVVVPAGTVVAGADPTGQPVYFATMAEAQLRAWRVAALVTLFVARPNCELPLGLANQADTTPTVSDWVTGVYASAVVDPATGAGPGVAAGPWLPFGEDPALRRAGYPALAARAVGFAVAAPVLALREGLREITLRIRATPESFATCQQRLDMAVSQLRLSEAEMLGTMFGAAITGPVGWLPLTVLRVEAERATATLTWTLLLDREQPAAVGYAPAAHGGRYTTTAPLVRLLLNPQAPIYGYSYWHHLQPVVVQVEVDVKHLRGIELNNQLVTLNSNKPFFPFGAQAGPGAYLLVGVPELLGKHLTNLKLALTWQNLPPEGFAAYYAGYTNDAEITNDSFTVRVSYLAGYHWQPPEAQRPVQPLFPAAKAAGQPATNPVTLLHLRQPGYLDPAPGSHTGQVRIELVGPPQGFGATDYPVALARAVQYNAHHAARPVPVPRPPLVPQLSQLTVSYQATERLEPSQGPQASAPAGFFHITPLAEYEPATAGPLRLLPHLPHAGTLYVGLDPAAAGQLIDLVLSLAAPAQPDQVLPTVHWAYLDRDEWRPISPAHAGQAAVPGFVASLHVRVSLPADLPTTSQLLPDGYCWLRATIAGNAAAFGAVQGIFSQLVRARRTNTGPAPSAAYVQPLPVGSLTHLPRPLPGIRSVVQPAASFGGRPAEDQPAAYYTRVGEQLRHRGRALTPWDYERLVLDQFAEVYAARCLTADQLPAAPLAGQAPSRVPGIVWVVVLPRPTANAALPLFGAAELAAMQHYLRARASPAVQVRVRNASYEAVQVHATVAFERLAAGATLDYAQQLQHELAAFLSPWGQSTPQRGGFHHHLTVPAIEAFVSQRPYVTDVTGFSVVKTGLLDGRHRFYDSATDPATPLPVELGRLVPWAVLVPAAQHVIRVGEAPLPTQVAQATGIGSLRIEEDFVVACGFDDDAA